MNPAKPYVALAVCILALQGCSSGFTPSVTGNGAAGQAADKTASVSLKGSQQGQAGGFADFDGDGIDDLLVGAPYARGEGTVGALLVYRGNAGGFDAKPAWVLTGDDNFGYRVKNIGDADGDGKADFAVAAYNGNGSEVSLSGSITVFKGGAGGAIIARVAGEDALDKFGLSITAGDFDGDGKPELVVGAPFNSPSPALYQKGAVYIHSHPYNDATRITLAATATYNGLGNSIGAGDVNGDGIDDLLVGTGNRLLIYYGVRSGFTPKTDAPDTVISGAGTDGSFGASSVVINDLDGDGFNDIVVGAPKATISGAAGGSTEVGRIYVVKGGAGKRAVKLATTPNADLITRIDGAAFFDRFGFAVAPVGALSDDNGRPNFAVTAILADRAGATTIRSGLTSGKVYLFQGKDLLLGGAVTPISVGKVFDSPEYNMHYGNFLAPFTKNGPMMLIGAPTVNRQNGGTYVVNLLTGDAAAPVTQVSQTAGDGGSTTVMPPDHVH